MADNSAAFWRYNTPTPTPAIRFAPRRTPSPAQRRRNDERKSRQCELLATLIESDGKPIHVGRLAERIGRSQAATRNFMLGHDDGLWLTGTNGAWWRTTLRTIPHRLR